MKCNNKLQIRLFLLKKNVVLCNTKREVSEWLKEQAWKVCMWATASWVRIPSSLQKSSRMRNALSILAFFITLTLTAQNVETDFDAPDSLYREDQFYFSASYNILQQGPSGLRQNKFSTGLSAGFLRDMPLNKKRTFAIAAGIGYSFTTYNHNMGIMDVNGVTTYQILASDNVTFSKNKLSLHCIDLPIEFRWRNSTPESHKFWRVYTGLKLSYLFYDQYKLVSSQGNVGQNNLKDLNKFQYGIYLATGWNTWNIYAYYGLNPLFKSSAKIDGQSITMNTANFGLMFYIL